MSTYDFLTLSAYEFENLTRDLLQKHFNMFVESFTSGRDSGIDLRLARNEKNIIIQAKRYKTFSELKSNLKNEKEKINKLNPGSYIIATSVGLTPHNKDEIMTIFNPYILKTTDIFGKDDLNNLLAQFPEIEKQYYKLWLSSYEIMQKVLHSKVHNQSNFELDEIKKAIKIYVQNESHNRAFEILKNNHYVIISGIPGIGKTTLARMLVFQLLGKEFNEFIFLNDGINDGYAAFHENKKQVFYFDDFLGKNFLDVKPQINEDKKIIRFIDKIRTSKNKIFILTTREYILKQAKNTFAAFNNESIDLAKCTLDLSSYTKLIKAEILYNHLFFANIPVSHLQNLIQTKKYLNIINHENYNPRIIETFVQKKIWTDCLPEDFSKTIVNFFDNPESVWLHAFENTISKEGQVILLVLSTLGTPVLMEDLKDAVNSFFTENLTKYSSKIDSMLFQRVIKELENTFIITKMDYANKIGIEFQNPSIQDFLINYISNKDDLMEDLAKSFIFQEQIFTIFTTETTKKYSIWVKVKIHLNQHMQSFFSSKIINCFDLFKNCILERNKVYGTEQFRWVKNDSNLFSFLRQINEEFNSFKSIELLVTSILNRNNEPIFQNHFEMLQYVRLLSEIELDLINLDRTKLLKCIYEQISSIDEIKLLSDLKYIFEDEYEILVKNETFNTRIDKIVQNNIDKFDESDYDDLISELNSIQDDLSFNLESQIENLQEKYDGYLRKQENRAEADLDNYKIDNTENKNDEDIKIENIFSSLL